jgi:hypothetical protein
LFFLIVFTALLLTPQQGRWAILLVSRVKQQLRRRRIRFEALDRLANGGHEAVVHRFEQRGRGNRMTEIVAQVVTEAGLTSAAWACRHADTSRSIDQIN